MKRERIIIAILAAVVVLAVRAGTFVIHKNIDKMQSDNSLKLSDVASIQPFKNLNVSDVDSIMVYNHFTNVAHVLSDELTSEMVDILSEMKISVLPVKDEDAVMFTGVETRFSMLLKDGRIFEFVAYGPTILSNKIYETDDRYIILNNKRYETDVSVISKIAAIYYKQYPN